jgi:hypothetical protein
MVSTSLFSVSVELKANFKTNRNNIITTSASDSASANSYEEAYKLAFKIAKKNVLKQASKEANKLGEKIIEEIEIIDINSNVKNGENPLCNCSSDCTCGCKYVETAYAEDKFDTKFNTVVSASATATACGSTKQEAYENALKIAKEVAKSQAKNESELSNQIIETVLKNQPTGPTGPQGPQGEQGPTGDSVWESVPDIGIKYTGGKVEIGPVEGEYQPSGLTVFGPSSFRDNTVFRGTVSTTFPTSQGSVSELLATTKFVYFKPFALVSRKGGTATDQDTWIISGTTKYDINIDNTDNGLEELGYGFEPDDSPYVEYRGKYRAPIAGWYRVTVNVKFAENNLDDSSFGFYLCKLGGASERLSNNNYVMNDNKNIRRHAGFYEMYCTVKKGDVIDVRFVVLEGDNPQTIGLNSMVVTWEYYFWWKGSSDASGAGSGQNPP